jgi:hypothetical protein
VDVVLEDLGLLVEIVRSGRKIQLTFLDNSPMTACLNSDHGFGR